MTISYLGRRPASFLWFGLKTRLGHFQRICAYTSIVYSDGVCYETRVVWTLYRIYYLMLNQLLCRLIDLAPKYFDPSSFPEGEMRTAIERYWSSRNGQTERHGDESESTQAAGDNTIEKRETQT